LSRAADAGRPAYFLHGGVHYRQHARIVVQQPLAEADGVHSSHFG
jgi:hypothetical protein